MVLMTTKDSLLYSHNNITTMSTPAQTCVFCNRECKPSDSKPYPNSRSKDRIHNRCQIKKMLVDKQKKPSSTMCELRGCGIEQMSASSSIPEKKPTKGLVEIMIEENEKLQNTARVSKINKLISDREDQAIKDHEPGFFFDVKAGIAKPHEKRQYLHHRSIRDIAPRFDDECHQEETIGRAFDHTGKDLDIVCDQDDKDCQFDEDSKKKMAFVSGKRKDPFEPSRRGHQTKKASTIIIDDKNPCWFCLSSPNIERHLIIAAGDYCYLSLAKGGLVDEHLLLIPVEHIHAARSWMNSKKALDELESFKYSLIDYFKRKSMGVIFFERNFRSVHWQIQVVPIEEDKLGNLAHKIKSISEVYYAKSNYVDIPENFSIDEIIPKNASYLYWQIEPIKHRFISQIETADSSFPIQLPRMVLADPLIMNFPDRIDWKRCSKDRDDYINLVERIRKDYQPYDFT